MTTTTTGIDGNKARTCRLRPRRRRWSAVTVGVFLVTALGACAISSEGSAHRLPRDEVPFDLAAVDSASTTSSVAQGPATTIYLIRKGRLMAVARSAGVDVTLDGVIALLLAGPDRPERKLDIATALPDGRTVKDVSVSRGTATVDLDPSFGDVAADDQVLAIAQIVFTLTDRPGIGGVRFSLGAKSIDVPRGDGALTVNALSRDDFRQLAPRTPS